MATYTANDLTWYYTLDANNNATIGNGSNSGATLTGANLSTIVTIPSAVGTQNYIVTGIAANAFWQCTMWYITIPNTVTSIGPNGFLGCSSLRSINLPNLLTSISNSAFQSCSKVTSVTIPNLVTSIGSYAFNNCSLLNSVMIGISVTIIDSYAFRNCTSLTSINIPDSVTSINGTPFSNTSANLVIIMNTGKFGITSPSTNQSFFGGVGVTFVLPPTMTITSTTLGVTSDSITNNASIALTFTSSASTSDFVVGGISVTNGTLSAFTGSGSVYNATFTPTSQGLCTINVPANKFTAGGGYNNASTTFNWTFDNVSPSMTITSTTLGVTNGSIANNKFIELTFTSTEATTNFVVGDISVTNGTLSNFTGIGAVYTATFTPVNDGACTINVAAGAYTDAAGNNNTAATFNWTFSTAWNVGTNSNHLIKSYVKDFVDVSGSVVLRANSNLYISGNTETAGNLLLNRLVVQADASFNRRIFVGGDVSMNGTVTVSGDLSMNGSVTKCAFNNSSIPKSAFASTVPDGADYNTPKIVYVQTFQANDDVSMNGLTIAANNVIVSGNIVFNDGTFMNTYDNNILSTNPTVFNSSTFTALDICGNLVAGSYATSSDYRIKTNVVELDETYTVDKLRPVKYFQTQINREKYGLIAHELQEHYPDLVVGAKDGSELQRVNYTGLIAILINDIKRLKQNLAELESGI